ncbi:MAG: helix-turn-helix domain-containing protein [Paracoccaceae bacterium]
MLVPRKKNEDLRNYSVLPFDAARDTRLHGTAALSVLCVLCTYTDQLGVTWVSQGRIAKDMGISRTAVTRQIKKLIEFGYLEKAKKFSKHQKSDSLRVVFKRAPKDLNEAKANLTASEQIRIEEQREEARKEQLFNYNKAREKQGLKPVDNSTTCYTQRSHLPVTSRGNTNENIITNNNNIIYDEARRFCTLFLRICESYGTPRQINERDIETVSHWIKDGLTMEEWSNILKNHAEYCYKTRRDIARGIGYFKIPVSKALGKSNNHRANDILKGIVKDKRL